LQDEPRHQGALNQESCVGVDSVKFSFLAHSSLTTPVLLYALFLVLQFLADIPIEEAKGQEWDLIALPGGMPGAEHLRDCDILIDLLKEQKAKGKIYAAVCASPAVVLQAKDLIDTAGHTCYPAPGFRSTMKDPVDTDVVVQENVATSKGPGTSLKFALSLGEMLYGKEMADQIATQMLVVR